MTADMLEFCTFNEDAFVERVAFITVLPDNVLEYNFTNGHTAQATWKDRSRSKSWTEEMRQAAAEKTWKRSEKKCQEQ